MKIGIQWPLVRSRSVNSSFSYQVVFAFLFARWLWEDVSVAISSAICKIFEPVFEMVVKATNRGKVGLLVFQVQWR